MVLRILIIFLKILAATQKFLRLPKLNYLSSKEKEEYNKDYEFYVSQVAANVKEAAKNAQLKAGNLAK